jgi:ubiquinone/menaquinone biosynthesis C-methylase UbiE
MSVPEFDLYVKEYAQEIDNVIGVFGKKQEFFTRHKADSLLKAFAGLGQDVSKLRVLDVGCGTGMIHCHLVDSVGELHGVDVSGMSIEYARQHNPAVIYKSYDGRVLPYENSFFDCAFAICVLHHVPVDQWDAFIADMRRVVRPGGLVLLIEHNPFNPATQWVVNTCRFDANAHLVRPGRLRRLLRSAGVGQVWTEYVLFTPFAHKVFRMLDRVLSRVPMGAQYVMAGTVGRDGTAR